MKQVTYIAIILITVFNTASCQSIKISTINEKALYQPSDTLIVRISNLTKDSVRYYFGLECFFENEWSEIDNDIFRDEPKENYFFGVKSKSSVLQKIPVSLLDIDSVFINMKYRIIVKALPINTLIYQTYHMPAFEIKE
jgi:hypothetical protein